MRSRLTWSKPAARASRAAAAARPGVWRRSSNERTCGAADCIPSEIRVKPGSRSAASDAGVDAVGVGLDGHLGAGLHEIYFVRSPLRCAAEVGGRQQRRRPAAEEDGPQGRRAAKGSGRGSAISLSTATPANDERPSAETGGVRVEVAVRQPRRAVRHVDVHTERPLGRAEAVQAPPPAGRRRRARRSPSGSRAIAASSLVGPLAESGSLRAVRGSAQRPGFAEPAGGSCSRAAS